MGDYREAWEGAISVCRERNDEITRLRAELASAAERVAEMQAEAGMYHSLYDVATERLASARKTLEEIDAKCSYFERIMLLPDVREFKDIWYLARAALTDENGKPDV